MPRKRIPTPNEDVQLHTKYVQGAITEMVNHCRDCIIEEFTGSNTIRISVFASRCPEEGLPIVIEILEKKGWKVKEVRDDGPREWELSPATKVSKSKTGS